MSRDCPLTQIQLDILTAVAHGQTCGQIAADRGVSVSTIRTHLHRVYEKLQVPNSIQAAIRAYCEGWIEIPLLNPEQRFLARIAALLDRVHTLIEDRRPITREQRRYLQLFDRYLRAPNQHTTAEMRERMVDQLHVVLAEGGVDRRAVTHQRRRRK